MGALIVWIVVSVVIILISRRWSWQVFSGRGYVDLKRFQKAGFGLGIILFVWAIISTSYVIIPQDKVGNLKKVFGSKLPEGKIIAMDGQMGPQARILGPGFNFELFLNIIYKVEEKDIQIIPENSVAILVAQDGQPLGKGQFIAEEWPLGHEKEMLDATYFLKHSGQIGIQYNVLTPGSYRLNLYLWKVILAAATRIEPGEVGVVKSNYGKVFIPEPRKTEMLQQINLVVPLVPKGYIGVWNEPLLPGNHYINPQALEIHKISTRLLSWEYKGGFKYYRKLQKVRGDEIVEEDHPITEDAADGAIYVRSKDGFDVPFEIRVQGQVMPEKAPFVYAAAGDLQKIEDNVLTPVLRSVVRNSGVPHNALDYLNKRPQLEEEIEKAIRPEVEKVGFSIQEIRIGEIFIPWELKDTQTRQELAVKVQNTYQEEKKAQDERAKMEAAKATANKQPELVAQKIAVEKSELKKTEKLNLGQAEANYLSKLAEGQAKQVAVLGQDRVMQLELTKILLEAAVRNPSIVKVPQVNVQGAGTSLEGAAAVLGSSNLLNVLRQPQEKEQK